jgi:CO dehydrogenase maturation factor
MARTIAVAGKGGIGKTTIAALIIRHLIERASGPLLAIDADPAANLGILLGITVEKTIGDLREETLRQMKDFPPGMSKEAYIEMGLHQIIVETPKFDLITMGRSEGPACYCYINNLLRKFTESLDSHYEWAVMDNEAGLEHISRRTASKVDYLIVVANENPLSFDSARKIDTLITEIKNPVHHKYLLLNAVREEKIESLRRRAANLSFQYLGAIPYDRELEEIIFRGESILGIQESVAVLKIDRIMEKIGAQSWK